MIKDKQTAIYDVAIIYYQPKTMLRRRLRTDNVELAKTAWEKAGKDVYQQYLHGDLSVTQTRRQLGWLTTSYDIRSESKNVLLAQVVFSKVAQS